MHLGPVPLRAYALMIVAGIIVAVVVTARRLRARGVDPVVASEAAYWAVPFGIVGARIYHVISSPEAYFGKDGDLGAVLEVWNGGLAIWGAVAGGALGAWIACRRMNVPFGLFADAVAPGLALAQAIGRWGNWFNQELYGRATDLPWAVRIDPAHQMIPGVSTYHPTFLYESLWNLAVAGLLLLVDRRSRLGRGRLFFLYVALYTTGRLWIEALRIDTAEKILGLRVNIWVSIVVLLLALLALALVRRPVDPSVGWPAPTGVGSGGGDGTAAAAGGAEAGVSKTGGPTGAGGAGVATGAGDAGSAIGGSGAARGDQSSGGDVAAGGGKALGGPAGAVDVPLPSRPVNSTPGAGTPGPGQPILDGSDSGGTPPTAGDPAATVIKGSASSAGPDVR